MVFSRYIFTFRYDTKVIKWIRAKFGKNSITPNLRKKIRAHLNILEDFHESHVAVFQDKEGKDFKTTLTKVVDLNLFVDEICKIRNIKEPEVTLGCDGDTEKCIVTMVIREAGETDDEAPANYKPTGKNRVFTIAKVDEVPENRHNVE